MVSPDSRPALEVVCFVRETMLEGEVGWGVREGGGEEGGKEEKRGGSRDEWQRKEEERGRHSHVKHYSPHISKVPNTEIAIPAA